MPSVPSFKRARPCLGTTLEISIEWPEPELCEMDETQVHLVMTEAFELAQNAHDLCSFFDPQSELSRLNRSRGEWLKLDPFLQKILEQGAQLEREFGPSFHLARAGAVDTRTSVSFSDLGVRKEIDGDLDLGGIAKGVVIDRVYDFLCETLGPGAHVVVNAGGDLRASGVVRAEVRVSDQRYELQLMGSALATSSQQKEGPFVGRASASYLNTFRESTLDRVASVSVVAETCTWADAFTKIAFQRDLKNEMSSAEALRYGLQAILWFDHDGQLLEAVDW